MKSKRVGNIIDYRKITKETEADLRLPNEAFELFGKMLVERIHNEWSYKTELFNQTETMTFPDENYQYEEINKNGFAIGAYDGDICVGLAIYQHHWNKYMFLHDLKVKHAFRKQGIASALIKEGQKYATELDYKGIYTVGQDNNLAACNFYLKQGFEIGGFNTRDYQHTQQEEKSDIYFYLENKR